MQNKKIKRYRNFFVNLLNSLPHLFTQKDIVGYFKKKKIKIDRTTIYRNIKKLKKDKIIFEADYVNGMTFYEKKDNQLDHHHHFICQKCLKSFSFSDEKIEKNITDLKEKLKKQIKAEIISHNFNLSGFCNECRKII